MRYIYFKNPTQKRWYWRVMNLPPEVEIDPEKKWHEVAHAVIHPSKAYRTRRFCIRAATKHKDIHHPNATLELISHPIIRGRMKVKLKGFKNKL